MVRGQATPIQYPRQSHSEECQQQKYLRTGFLPTSSPSTISSRLGHPWFQQNRARTSGKTRHLEASRSIFSSRYMQNTHQQKPMQNLFFSRRYLYPSGLNTKRIGGAERDRTADPLLAKQVLSQLSYSPNHRNT
jgi:hypothetical protein